MEQRVHSRLELPTFSEFPRYALESSTPKWTSWMPSRRAGHTLTSDEPLATAPAPCRIRSAKPHVKESKAGKAGGIQPSSSRFQCCVTKTPTGHAREARAERPVNRLTA